MDLGLLFRKRLHASQEFLKILSQRTYLAKDETPAEILKSYLLALIGSKIICSPFDVAELICQTKPRTLNVLQTALLLCIRTPGKRKLLFSGLGIDMASLVPNIFVENIIFDSLSNVSLSRLFSSLVSKLISTIVSYPFEVLRTRTTVNDLNTNIYCMPSSPTTFKSCIIDIWKEPYHAGLPLTLFKVLSYIVCKEFLYNQFRYIGLKKLKRDISRQDQYRFKRWQASDDDDEYYERKFHENFGNTLMLDYLSGLFSEFITFPLSVLVRNLQLKNENWKDLVVKIWKEEGIRGFYKGSQYHFVSVLLIYFGTMGMFGLTRSWFLSYKQKSEEEDEDDDKTKFS